jgi:hypothetical protein
MASVSAESCRLSGLGLIRWVCFPVLLGMAVWVGLVRSVAAADAIALNFDLPPVTQSEPSQPETAAQNTAAQTDGPILGLDPGPLPIPEGAGHPPTTRSRQPMPASVYGDPLPLVAAEATLETVIAALPPMPAIAPHEAVLIAEAEAQSAPAAPTEALSFALGNEAIQTVATASDPKPEPEPASEPEPDPTPAASPVATGSGPTSTFDQDAIFQGGSESLVARVVGSAEGTRTAEGHRTPGFYGHVDPGNGVWNLGTFSYQHGASSPEEADRRQLQRLRNQTRTLEQRASTVGLTLSLPELLNGIDLANQAPAAALGRQGYLDWLAEAHHLGMAGDEAILWARTRAFLDPDTQRWNAPGLGNTVAGISRDQERRMVAIERALVAFDPGGIPSVVAKEPEVAPTDSAVGGVAGSGSGSAIAGEPDPSPNSEVLDFVGMTPAQSLHGIPPSEPADGAADLSPLSPGANMTLSVDDLFAEAELDWADAVALAQPAALVVGPKGDDSVLT